jgi:hypothetical protein
MLLNVDKSKVVACDTAYQLKSAVQIDTMSVAGAKLNISSEMKSLCVILDQRLSFDQHLPHVGNQTYSTAADPGAT